MGYNVTKPLDVCKFAPSPMDPVLSNRLHVVQSSSVVASTSRHMPNPGVPVRM